MKLYLKGDYTKKIPYGYLELAGKMWFPEDEQISYSNAGNNDALQEDFFSNLSLRKGTADKRWSSVPLKEGVRSLFSHIEECIEINFEDAFATDFNEKGDYLRILTSHLEVLTIDKRAMYIMALEIAKVIDGQISEDGKNSWLTIEEFKRKHETILSLTFEEANELSLTEIQTMDVVDDPLWEEEANSRKEYILAHGGDISDL
ncbi:hypothetical protein [Streptococcus sanguinis]|jgi:hypothetical protein|uniref:Uncharacterized protein n=1 Tax=Streptococcus sanguinis TaxID=1305 RepID=A0AB74DLE1_STRSA|nr:hypothetical protein [Streptococcus sanguinis]MBZ2062344.1 hypothetical protein [Streptococcus sanguinis]MBZ2064555.1 hypothetical protein [Streptococcus sanguinis]RSI32687.1 hypothetical protein D8879_04215 [Streptococcus sanguinis]RSI37126.1 hypothetical protein D8878_03770 [Streptococcus sanguinis]